MVIRLQAKTAMLTKKHYFIDDAQDVFADWRNPMKDVKAKIAIDRCIFGDHKP
jgi:putative component of toxin-antitoxin plasmid stabilization module